MECGQRLFGLINAPLLQASVGDSILHGEKVRDTIKTVYSLYINQIVHYLWYRELLDRDRN